MKAEKLSNMSKVPPSQPTSQFVHLTIRRYIQVNAQTLQIRVMRGQPKPLGKLWGPLTSPLPPKSLIWKQSYHETLCGAIIVVAIQRNEKNHKMVKWMGIVLESSFLKILSRVKTLKFCFYNKEGGGGLPYFQKHSLQISKFISMKIVSFICELNCIQLTLWLLRVVVGQSATKFASGSLLFSLYLF